jgi:hypothetical protein
MKRFPTKSSTYSFWRFSAAFGVIPTFVSACSSTPAIRVETQIIKVPVTVACVRASDIPAKPALLGSQLTGNPVHDLDLVTAQLLRFMTYGEVQAALLSGCVAP